MAQRSSNDILDDILTTLGIVIQEQRSFQNKILNEVKNIKTKQRNNSNQNQNNTAVPSTTELLMGTSKLEQLE